MTNIITTIENRAKDWFKRKALELFHRGLIRMGVPPSDSYA